MWAYLAHGCEDSCDVFMDGLKLAQRSAVRLYGSAVEAAIKSVAAVREGLESVWASLDAVAWWCGSAVSSCAHDDGIKAAHAKARRGQQLAHWTTSRFGLRPVQCEVAFPFARRLQTAPTTRFARVSMTFRCTQRSSSPQGARPLHVSNLRSKKRKRIYIHKRQISIFSGFVCMAKFRPLGHRYVCAGS